MNKFTLTTDPKSNLTKAQRRALIHSLSIVMLNFQNVPEDEILRAVNAPYSYKGTNNMTEEELKATHEYLFNNYKRLTEGGVR